MTQPQSTEVTKFHTNCDRDSSQTSDHHTLGTSHNQASPGDHTHDGRNSKKIGKGLDPTFPSVAAGAYSTVQMQAVLDALRDLGFGT